MTATTAATSRGANRRLAMWSGPRNISTAVMRAWENRTDTEVWDEPFYGPYLASTGLDHPGAAEIIAAQGNDWRRVAERCAADAPSGKPVFFQKHMTQHMVEGMGLDWMGAVTNCFLIRQPDEVLVSYRRSRPDVTAADLGFERQAELVTHVDTLAGEAVVIESSDLLKNPRTMLGALCDLMGLPFEDNMLEWLAGERDSDGVWGKYWYDTVWASTGFATYRPRDVQLQPEEKTIVEYCQPFYDRLYARRLRP
jgi:hypothetical protein